MKGIHRTRAFGIAAFACFACAAIAGCSNDILNYNLRANFSSFLIGVFSDSVHAAVSQ